MLRPGGLLAFLSYGLWYLPDHPSATDVIRRVMLKELAPYWEEGRSHVDAEIDTIPSPSSTLWRHPYRCKWTDDPSQTPAYRPPEVLVHVDERKPAVLDRSWDKAGIGSYIKSFSAIHTQEERHGAGLSDRFADELWSTTGKDPSEPVTVRWPVTLLASVRS